MFSIRPCINRYCPNKHHTELDRTQAGGVVWIRARRHVLVPAGSPDRGRRCCPGCTCLHSAAWLLEWSELVRRLVPRNCSRGCLLWYLLDGPDHNIWEQSARQRKRKSKMRLTLRLLLVPSLDPALPGFNPVQVVHLGSRCTRRDAASRQTTRPPSTLGATI